MICRVSGERRGIGIGLSCGREWWIGNDIEVGEEHRSMSFHLGGHRSSQETGFF